MPMHAKNAGKTGKAPASGADRHNTSIDKTGAKGHNYPDQTRPDQTRPDELSAMRAMLSTLLRSIFVPNIPSGPAQNPRANHNADIYEHYNKSLSKYQ